jgi:tetratricopeptide (TPR) repeat protein
LLKKTNPTLASAVRRGAVDVNDNQPRQPVLSQLFQRYLSDENTARFIADVSQHYTIGSLERLAEYGDRMCRRASTMALGFMANYSSNAVLGRRMVDEDRGVRLLAENGIRELWFRDGSEDQRKLLGVVARLNRSEQFQQSALSATNLIDEAPWIAEAWNQRAIAYFHLGRFLDSANDCHQTLELNAYHYAAAVGMGMSYLEMEELRAALDCFKRAIKLNPDLEDVRTRIMLLKQSLKKRKR